ncbi:hypothetical protein NC653_018982 [Populus alba x Populus x berolinensis]|uniref:Uncharacterized protein n=1 Tax=Populus alba x Populus x berolinensis TaxID=444605 RepID=A0AAD6QHP6_9ROSI|nr:hypothetical protein NC653_018982 [Populus alba x Populus x berolinensis]
MPCSGCCGYGQELSSCWGFDINGQLPVSGALNLKVLERKGDRMRFVVITVTRLPHLVELRGNTDKRAMNLKLNGLGVGLYLPQLHFL